MINKIYSNNKKTILCAFICRDNISTDRTNISSENDFLQVAVKKLNIGDNVAPHKHNPIERYTTGTQESWIVLQGSVKANIFDTNGAFMQSVVLNDGDIIIFFYGGHELITMKNDTLFCEIKNGPYYGTSADKQNL